MTHLTETNYLKACCSEDSYYQCLEKDLANKTECGGLCEVVSMPNDLLPLCSSVRQYECSKSVFNQRIKDENHPCRKEKSCSDLTYDLQELHFEWNWTLDIYVFGKIGFMVLKFLVSKRSKTF